MQFSIFKKVVSVSMAVMFILSSSGLGMMTPRHAEAQGIVDFVIGGAQVLDGCDGITGSKYQEIATQLGIDLEGGVRAGLSDLGGRLQDPASDLGGSILDGLSSLGSKLGDSAIGDAIGSLGSSIGDAFGGAGSGIGDAIGSVAGVLGGPVGGILGSVVGGLFGGGEGPDKVAEEGLRKIVKQGQRIAQFNQQKIIEKDRCLDSLARQAGQTALRNFTSASVDWLNDGFERGGKEGNRAFVQDLSLFVAEVSDVEIKDFAAESSSLSGAFSNTCNSFSQSVFSTIVSNYFANTPGSGVDQGNIRSTTVGSGNCLTTENFLRGDFSDGGWDSLAQSVSDSDQNPIGSFLRQSSGLNQRISEAEQNEREELQWGQGFLANESGGFTPASVVNGISNRLFESDFNRLELIDEMGEVAGSFAKSLIGKVTGLSDDGSSTLNAGTGLSTLDPNNTVGGDSGQEYSYLAESLRNRVADQLAIEEEVQLAISDVLPLYVSNGGQVDALINEMRTCLETTDFTSRNAAELLGSIVDNKERFESTVLQNRVRIDWRGEDIFWQGVIREESRKMIGWTGTDYDWANDGVERYGTQGFSISCEDRSDGGSDGGNASYVIRQEILPNPETDFNGAFHNLERDETDRFDESGLNTSFINDHDTYTDRIMDFATWIDSQAYADLLNSERDRNNVHPLRIKLRLVGWVNRPERFLAEVHTVWEKQICAVDGSDAHWQERLPIVDHDEREHFPDTPAGQRRAQNAQCDLIQEHEFCIFPAYRGPQIIAGEMYQRNADGEIEESRCQTRGDAGTHYYVRSGDTNWSTRQCNLRQSPQGSAVEWEGGFLENTEGTNFPAYELRETDDPLEDQELTINVLRAIQFGNNADLVGTTFSELQQQFEGLKTGGLEGMIASSNNPNASSDGFRDLQAVYYQIQDNFNNRNTASNLRNNARTFVENVREINEALLESESCEGGSEEMRLFGSDFLNDNPVPEDKEEEVESLSINNFNVARPIRSSNFIRVSWDSNAGSCSVESNPNLSGWQEGSEVGSSGSLGLSSPNAGLLSITCTLGEESDTRTETYPAKIILEGDGGGRIIDSE